MAMHRINRSEIELHTGEAALARALFERIGRIYGPRIAPVFDRVCSELSASEAPVRIDRLEVDLGTFAADDVEDALVARLEPALRAALQEALRRKTGGNRSARDSLELLETFAFTGGLPWWAPPDRGVVAHHLARASAEAEADLVALLGRIAQDPGALERITRLCGRNTLAALVERAQAHQRRPAGQPSANPGAGDDAARRRQRVEPTAVDEAQAGARDIGRRGSTPSSDDPPIGDARAAASSAASHVTDGEPRPLQQAGPTAIDEAQAGARDIGRRGSTPSSDDPPVRAATAAASSAASHVTDGEPRPLQQAGPTALEGQQAHVQDIGRHGSTPSSDDPPVRATTAAASSAASPGTDDELRRRRRADPATLGEPQARTRDIGRRDLASSSDVAAVEDATAAASSTASPGGDGELRRRQRAAPTLLDRPRSPAQSRALPAPDDPAAIRARRRGALARLDELYVDDAGLVILWPFLERFLLRAGVLGEDRGFLDEGAQLQAVALVDSLATSDPAPLEFRLPLAKLLCGRPFESNFALERPLAAEQLAEGDRLLAAVIDRVPALGEASIAELRVDFLARPGVLGARDGAWLLQVERRPHDIALDRFPWSWGWVRLPWMPGPLRVEW